MQRTGNAGQQLIVQDAGVRTGVFVFKRVGSGLYQAKPQWNGALSATTCWLIRLARETQAR